MMGQVAASGAPHQRVLAYLLLGRLREAMTAARQAIVDDKGGPSGALEIARVFKAADGNLIRGNQWLDFFKDGKGVNPIEAFFKEYLAAPAPAEPGPQ